MITPAPTSSVNVASRQSKPRTSTFGRSANASRARVIRSARLKPGPLLELWPVLARQLEQDGWLAALAWIYVESPRGHVPALPPNWQLHREGQAGEVRFALYRRALPLS